MLIQQGDKNYGAQASLGSDNFNSGLSVGNLFRSGASSLKAQIETAGLHDKPVQIIYGGSKITVKKLTDIEILAGKNKLVVQYIGMDNRAATKDIPAKDKNFKLRIIDAPAQVIKKAPAATLNQTSSVTNKLHAAPVIEEAVAEVEVKPSSPEAKAQTQGTEIEEKLAAIINKDHELCFMTGSEWGYRLVALVDTANEVLKGKTIKLSYTRLLKGEKENYSFKFGQAMIAGAYLIFNNDQGQKVFSCERHLGRLQLSLEPDTNLD